MIMRQLKTHFLTVFASMFIAGVTSFAHADTVTVSGVKLDDTVQVGNQTLKINGAGVRTKFIVKVYVAALYLPEIKTTTAEVLALTGAKRVHLVMMRDLTNDDFSQAFMDGLKNNIDVSERGKLIQSMITFGQMFSHAPNLKKGDTMTFDWVPGTGIVCQFNGKNIGETINDPLFYSAVLRIWLGNKPPDATLKVNLLNKHF